MSKGLEAVNRVVKNTIALRDRDEFEGDMLIIAKELKALEIIKKKGLYWDIQYQPFEEENDYRAWDNELYQSIKLTKEEYDLLKEVLNNDQ